MNRRIRSFFFVAAALSLVLAVEILYFSLTGSVTAEGTKERSTFVRWVRLPDLSVSTEARFIRFRSLADVYSPFNESPELLDYFPASFTYAPSETEVMNPSKIVIQ
ncbi:hypothetical protein [Hydrogenimonas sp.]|uniref:hypothetical protein n=1 Tax=Hydrogenimonas sp. TaxID=2231112 RepID=UPI00262282F3|nr:hypothetical protein [Hydrogenimonas sp.]